MKHKTLALLQNQAAFQVIIAAFSVQLILKHRKLSEKKQDGWKGEWLEIFILNI